jgi:hypothetical protein
VADKKLIIWTRFLFDDRMAGVGNQMLALVSADPKIAEPSLDARPRELRCRRQDNIA